MFWQIIARLHDVEDVGFNSQYFTLFFWEGFIRNLIKNKLVYNKLQDSVTIIAVIKNIVTGNATLKKKKVDCLW